MGQSELITTAWSRSGKQIHPLPPCPVRGSREEGEVGSPRTFHLAQAICITQVHAISVRGACAGLLQVGDVCRSVPSHTSLELWPDFSRGQVGQDSRGPSHPIPGVWGHQLKAHEAGPEG